MSDKRIAELREQIAPLQNEIWELEEARRFGELEVLVGKFFVYSNSYSGDVRWPLYQKVVKVDGKLYAVGGQYDKRGSVEIRCKELFSFSGTETLGTEISEDEWVDGVSACMKRAQAFLQGEPPTDESSEPSRLEK